MIGLLTPILPPSDPHDDEGWREWSQKVERRNQMETRVSALVAVALVTSLVIAISFIVVML